MADEMAFHLEARREDLVRRGMTEEAAARQARLEFGSVEGYREEGRAAMGYRLWDELRGDARYALRGMGKSPGFVAAAVAILGLAIGVNGAFFTLYSNYVLKPLAIRGAERHYRVEGRAENRGGTWGWSEEELGQLQAGTKGMVEGIYTQGTFQTLVVAPVQRQSLVTVVSPNYFSLLGGKARAGRTLAAGDENAPVAVLSATGAARFFPGVAAPVGERVRVRGTVLTVIGVMGAEFTGTEAAVPDLWAGRGMNDALRGRIGETSVPRYAAWALLEPGISPERVAAALVATARHFARPGEASVARVELVAQRSLLPEVEELNAAAALVFGAFWMVLLIACANLANLHLARAAARTHEIAMRLSLGASRWRIVRQLLTESTLLALAGAAAGSVLAVAGVERAHAYAVSLAGVGGLVMMPVSVDWRVLLYSGLLGVTAGVLFGLLPALEVTSPSLTVSTKRENSAFAGRVRPRRMRDVLIGGQVAASLVLLILGGVLIRNVQRLAAVEPGYDMDRVYDLRLNDPAPGEMEKLRRVEGVGELAAAGRVPLYGRLDGAAGMVDGKAMTLRQNRVDERYFRVLGLTVEGRGFTAAETEGQAKVAVISRATAGQLWPGQGAVGRTVELDGVRYEVIGVVGDVVSGWLFEGPDRTAVYLPGAAGQAGMGSAVARITGNPVRTAAALRERCADGAGCEPGSLREVSAMQTFPFRIAAGVAGTLGGLALLLTGMGLYSVVSYSVVQRRRELGVHLALGASPAQVVRRILGEAWRCVAGGVVTGLPVCLGLSALAAGSFLQVQTFDPWAYVTVPVLLAIIATIACAGPARKAARTDPAVSLREE